MSKQTSGGMETAMSYKRPDRDTLKAETLERVHGIYAKAAQFDSVHTTLEVFAALKDVQQRQDDLSHQYDTYADEGKFVLAYKTRLTLIRINRNVTAMLDPHMAAMRQYLEASEDEAATDDYLFDVLAEQDTDQLLDAFGLMEYDIAESKALTWSYDAAEGNHHSSLYRHSLRGLVSEVTALEGGAYHLTGYRAEIIDEQGKYAPIVCPHELTSLDDAKTWVGARI